MGFLSPISSYKKRIYDFVLVQGNGRQRKPYSSVFCPCTGKCASEKTVLFHVLSLYREMRVRENRTLPCFVLVQGNARQRKPYSSVFCPCTGKCASEKTVLFRILSLYREMRVRENRTLPYFVLVQGNARQRKPYSSVFYAVNLCSKIAIDNMHKVLFLQMSLLFAILDN